MPRGRRGRPADPLKQIIRDIEGILEDRIRSVIDLNQKMESALSQLGGTVAAGLQRRVGARNVRRARKVVRRVRKLSAAGKARIAAAAKKRWAAYRKAKAAQPAA